MHAKFLTAILISVILFVIAGESYAHNQPPVADLKAVPQHILPGSSVTLDGSDSYDPDGSIRKYEWDFDFSPPFQSDYYETAGHHPDGAFDGITTHTYDNLGNYIAKLRVTDNGGLKNSDPCTIYVSKIVNITQDTNHPSIQDAINNANNDDTIAVYKGAYNEAIDFNSFPCTLKSADPNDWSVVAETIINADDGDANVVTFENSSVLKGFTITGGARGIYCDSASPTISNCVITDNNCSGYGGGIYDCNFSSPSITNCFFSENKANFGGGMYNVNSSPTVTNCVFAENTADVNGAGIYDYNSSPEVNNCTFSGNSAGDDGGGIYNFGVSSSPNLANCIFWGNSAVGDGNEVFNSTDPNAVPYWRYCDIKGCKPNGVWDVNFGSDGGGNIDSDPNFIDANDPNGWDDMFGTYNDGLRLRITSPCIDAGDGNEAPSNDILGDGRVDINDVNNTGTGDPNYTDMGAYELQEIWFVDTDANGSNNGTSWQDAFADLQKGLSEADDGDEIWVAEGTYKPDGNDPNNRSLSFELVEGVRVYGGFSGSETARIDRDWILYETILSGDINTPNDVNDNSYHVVKGADKAVLDGFTVTGGRADGSGSNLYGGGIYCYQVSPTISNCTIADNSSSGEGGGMHNSQASPTVTNCFFSDNYALGYGGGMYNYYKCSALITNCVFSDNEAGRGGGAINSTYSYLTLINSTISGNTASSGGGMYNNDSDPTVTNCIFWGNDASSSGDEIYNYSSNPTFSYCDIKGCGGSGGGWDSSFGTDGGGNIDSDPRFVDINDPCGPDGVFGTADDGLRLIINSPCIDTADGDAAPLLDIAGIGRFDVITIDNTGTGDPNYADIGAYEWNNVWYVDDDADPNGDGKSWETAFDTIQEGINAAVDRDMVLVADGIYIESIDFNGLAITVTSTAPDDPCVVATTTIDANDTNLGIYVVEFSSGENANSILDGMTIRRGNKGIYCNLASPNIKNCIIRDNASYGIHCTNPCSPLITKCKIVDNSSHGVYTYGSYCSPEITDSIITDNLYGFNCGPASTPIVSGCTIILNRSHGVYSQGGVSLTNCVIAKNLGYGAYGGMENSIITCTVANNTTYGIRGFEEVKNCIVWDNDNDLHGCEGTYSCIKDDDPGLGNFSINPRFVSIDANNFHLKNWSRCIDWGDPSLDYSNEPNGGGGRINVGAYGNTEEAATLLDEDGDGLPDGWQEYYWPGYDPCDPNYGPGGNPDADDFNNIVEYFFGYEPNEFTNASMKLIVGLSAAKFDPTQEVLKVIYLLNMDANVVTTFTNTDSEETVRTISETVAAGQNEVVWDGKDGNGEIVERGFYDIAIDANDNDGNTANYDPGTVEVWYVHDINNLMCNPYRIVPMNNEVSKITYDLTVDANMVVTVYDPNGILFATLVDNALQTEGSHELIWYGRDKDPNDPTSRYISKEGAYLVRIKFVGMREKEEAVITAYK